MAIPGHSAAAPGTEFRAPPPPPTGGPPPPRFAQVRKAQPPIPCPVRSHLLPSAEEGGAKRRMRGPSVSTEPAPAHRVHPGESRDPVGFYPYQSRAQSAQPLLPSVGEGARRADEGGL